MGTRRCCRSCTRPRDLRRRSVDGDGRLQHGSSEGVLWGDSGGPLWVEIAGTEDIDLHKTFGAPYKDPWLPDNPLTDEKPKGQALQIGIAKKMWPIEQAPTEQDPILDFADAFFRAWERVSTYIPLILARVHPELATRFYGEKLRGRKPDYFFYGEWFGEVVMTATQSPPTTTTDPRAAASTSPISRRQSPPLAAAAASTTRCVGGGSRNRPAMTPTMTCVPRRGLPRATPSGSRRTCPASTRRVARRRSSSVAGSPRCASCSTGCRATARRRRASTTRAATTRW